MKSLNSKFYILNSFNNKGQSLIEALIALLIGAILIIASTTAIVSVLTNNLKAKNMQVAASLAQELLDNAQVISESDWNSLYIPLSSKGPSSQYYVSSTTRTIIAGNETLTVKGRNYTRYFSIENVNRGFCGTYNIIDAATSTCVTGYEISEDPSTQKITVFVTWAGNNSLNIVQYLTRHRDSVFVQTDWSGGATLSDEIVISPNNKFATSTNIDFSTTTGSIVLSAGLTAGYLTSSIFDTQRANGAAFNSLLWQGDLGDGHVWIEIASSATSTGPWDYHLWRGYINPAGFMNDNTSIPILSEKHNNKRYIRYRVYLDKTSNSPRIDDIIINWSP